MSSSERYEILQDDVDALLERIEASLDLVKKKKNLARQFLYTFSWILIYLFSFKFFKFSSSLI